MTTNPWNLHWRRSEAHPLLPDPDPRPIRHTLISVDDHLVEPPDMFTGRLPAHLQDRAPKVVETVEGHEVWEFDGRVHFQVGLNAVVGRDRRDWLVEPTRFEDLRPGCYEIDARVKDMDINGVWASVNFPSQITGFCGSVFSRAADPELGLSVTRAWNDWFFDEWYSPYPERIVPMGITFLGDPDRGAEEIRRNAARGFTAVTLPEQPHRIDLPSIFSGWWDPIITACADTGTVICLHVGSTGVAAMPPDAPMVPLAATLFGQLSLSACAEWLWSGYAVRFPDLKIAMSEGGIAWVPGLMDRLDHTLRYHEIYGTWVDLDVTPVEVLQRNFYHCVLDDPSNMRLRDRIGVDHIMVEADYPHLDSSWPNTQAMFAKQLVGASADDVRRITWQNAAELFRHPVPQSVIDDPESYSATAR